MIDFHTNQAFGAAAAKAFGLDPAMVTRTEISAANQSSMDKQFAITFEVLLSADDMVRIGEAMRASDDAQHSWTVDGLGFPVQYVDAQGRPITKEQNDALIAARDAALGQREVQHVDTPDEGPAGIPPHVWLYRNMLTDMQRLAPLGIDETNGQYAVAIDDLTDEQRAIPHVRTQLRNLHRAKVLEDIESRRGDADSMAKAKGETRQQMADAADKPVGPANEFFSATKVSPMDNTPT